MFTAKRILAFILAISAASTLQAQIVEFASFAGSSISGNFGGASDSATGSAIGSATFTASSSSGDTFSTLTYEDSISPHFWTISSSGSGLLFTWSRSVVEVSRSFREIYFTIESGNYDYSFISSPLGQFKYDARGNNEGFDFDDFYLRTQLLNLDTADILYYEEDRARNSTEIVGSFFQNAVPEGTDGTFLGNISGTIGPGTYGLFIDAYGEFQGDFGFPPAFYNWNSTFTLAPNPIPEPSTIGLIGVAACLARVLVSRKRSSKRSDDLPA